MSGQIGRGNWSAAMFPALLHVCIVKHSLGYSKVTLSRVLIGRNSVSTHQNGKQGQQVEICLQGAQNDNKAQLDPSIDIDPPVWNGTQVLVVRPVLVWDQHQLHPLQELHAVQGGHAQVEDQAVQDGKWEEIEGPVCHDGEGDEDGDHKKGHSLLPVKSEMGIIRT